MPGTWEEKQDEDSIHIDYSPSLPVSHLSLLFRKMGRLRCPSH